MLEIRDLHVKFHTRQREAVAGVSALAIQNARLHAALRAAFELQNTYTYQVFED